jgi:hypothetical protein
LHDAGWADDEASGVFELDEELEEQAMAAHAKRGTAANETSFKRGLLREMETLVHCKWSVMPSLISKSNRAEFGIKDARARHCIHR